MKRMLLALIALTLVSGAAFAQAPDSAYVGLFADDAHTVRRVDYVGPGFTPFNMYIWWLPSVRGINGAEFKISYPANVIYSTVTPNPGLTVQMGDLNAGISIAWDPADCQTTWVWSQRQACFLTSAVASQIMMVEHPGVLPPAYQVVTCELGNPIEPVKRFTHLYCNWDGGIAAESASWGAIKSLY